MKGRDLYDLFRYLSNGYQPNLDCIQEVADLQDLKEKLKNVVQNADFKVVVEDLASFLENDQLLNFLATNGKAYLTEQIEKMGQGLKYNIPPQ